ncbi:MAG: hypothetical protein JWO51_4229 [Rhodospirillales bacterium]|nr:hypothetical protein [Rhodospirillales bacterium]
MVGPQIADGPAAGDDPLAAGRACVVYGAGTAADRMLRIRGLSPSDVRFASTTGGGEFRGQPIMPASALITLADTAIVIASTFLTPILETLRDLDIDTGRIWWYFHEQDRLIPFHALGTTPQRADVLYAFYDLAMNPSTYDAVIFAARADVERRRRGLKYLQFTIVPSAISGGRPGDLELLGGLENVAWRQTYILNAVFRLVPAARGVTALASRADAILLTAAGAACFPAGYDPANPTDEHIMKYCYVDRDEGFEPRILKAPAKAVDFVGRFLAPRLNGRKLLVLTLREYGLQPDRNNDMAAWGAFVRKLDPDEYDVVVVRDTDSLYTPMPAPLEGYDDLPLASVDVNFRLALYEAAYLNLTVTTGPSALLYFSATARYLMFKQFLPQYVATAAGFQLDRNGMNVGDAYPLAGPFQKFIWEPDTEAVIQHEFDAMVAKIEARRHDDAR